MNLYPFKYQGASQYLRVQIIIQFFQNYELFSVFFSKLNRICFMNRTQLSNKQFWIRARNSNSFK